MCARACVCACVEPPTSAVCRDFRVFIRAWNTGREKEYVHIHAHKCVVRDMGNGPLNRSPPYFLAHRTTQAVNVQCTVRRARHRGHKERGRRAKHGAQRCLYRAQGRHNTSRSADHETHGAEHHDVLLYSISVKRPGPCSVRLFSANPQPGSEQMTRKPSPSVNTSQVDLHLHATSSVSDSGSCRLGRFGGDMEACSEVVRFLASTIKL